MANPQFRNLLVASVASPTTMVVLFSLGVLFIIACIGGQFTSSTLNCTACFSKTSWDDCKDQSFALPCSIVQVNDIHEGLVEFNPSLKPLPESTANVSFQCFSMELMSAGAPTGDFDRGFVSGCTFKQQKFCEGWIDEVQIERCDTCESEDICSLNEEEAEEEASTLNCTACFSKTSWDDCRGQSFALPCSIVQVNDIHEGLVEFNPSLKPLPESTANVSFQCFSVELKSVGAPTGDFDRGFVSGCTFKQQKFCEEWIDEVQIERCDTCESEDICSLNEEEGEVEGGEEEQQNNGTGSGNRLRISIFLLGLMMFVDVFWRCS